MSPMMTQAFALSPISTSYYRAIKAVCPLQKGQIEYIKVQQVNGNEKSDIFWPTKYFVKAAANLFSLIGNSCKGVQFQVTKNNIVIQFMSDNIKLDCQIKTHDGWVA